MPRCRLLRRTLSVDMDFFIFRNVLVTNAKVGIKKKAAFTQKSALLSLFGETIPALLNAP